MSSENKQSIIDEVSKNISEHGFLPIPVELLNDEMLATRYYTGDFAGFIQSAKALGAKAIFVEALYLESDEFFYESPYSFDDFDEECDDLDEFEDADEDDCEGCEDCDCKDNDDTLVVDESDFDGYDLSLIDKRIADYFEYLGEICGVRLTIPGVDNVQLGVFTDWYNEFSELVEEVCEFIELTPNEAYKQIEENSK